MSVMKLGGHECDVQRRRRCDFSHCVSCVIKQKISAYRRSGRAGRLLHGNGTRQVRVRSGQACVWRFGALPSTLGASFCFLFLFCFAQYGCCIHAIPGFLFSMQVHMKKKEVTQVFNTGFLFFHLQFRIFFFPFGVRHSHKAHIPSIFFFIITSSSSSFFKAHCSLFLSLMVVMAMTMAVVNAPQAPVHLPTSLPTRVFSNHPRRPLPHRP